MVQYNLEHLIQSDHQKVCGPIQDDEALFIYSVCRGRRLKYILEIGGLSGYSAINFCKAVEKMNGVVYTFDIRPVPIVSHNHKVVIKDAREISPSDVDNNVIDLVFFDCHDYDVQWKVFEKLKENNLIDDDTIIALHDTNTHPNKYVGFAYETSDGWVHARAERELTNKFKEIGYDVFNLHTKASSHDDSMPYRHGLSLCTKFKKLVV
jgi:predicted O-methyltransferase YrrM